MRKLTVVHCLVGLAVAWLVVDIANDATWRSIVLIIPIVVATAIAVVKPSWGANAAMPLFMFWLMPAVVFSLQVLGVLETSQQSFSYPYAAEPSAVNTALSALWRLVSAGFCLAGIVKAVPLGRTLSWPQRALFFAGFALLQVACVRISVMRLASDPII